MRTFLLCMTLVATSAMAQTAQRDPADPKQGAPAMPAHEPAFRDYRPYADPEVGRWRQANDEVGRLGGHMGHMPRKPEATPKPPAPHHGSHK